MTGVDVTMKEFDWERESPYTLEQMFDLAADVERYEEFLPGWHGARIYKRKDDLHYVEQELGYGPVRKCFTSKAILKRPDRIEIWTTAKPFRQLNIEWNIIPAVNTGCSVRFHTRFELRSRCLEKFLSGFFNEKFQHMVSAVEQRADQLYAFSEPSVGILSPE